MEGKLLNALYPRTLSSDSSLHATKFFYLFILVCVLVGTICSGVSFLMYGRNEVATACLLAFLVVLGLIGKYSVWQLADEVLDLGTSITIKRGSITGTLLLTDVDDVVDKPFWRPPTVIIVFLNRNALGDSITFLPDEANSLFRWRSDVAAELARKVRASKHEFQ